MVLAALAQMRGLLRGIKPILAPRLGNATRIKRDAFLSLYVANKNLIVLQGDAIERIRRCSAHPPKIVYFPL